MNKVTKIFVLAVLSVMTAPTAIFANYPTTSGVNPSNRQQQTFADQDQNSNDQKGQNMSGERSFMKDASNRYGRLKQEDRNMYSQDREMMRESYDPNEGQYDSQNAPQHDHDQQQHPVYEYMLGKDGKWHETTGHESGQEFSGDHAHETSARMNRQAQASSNPRSNSTQNADEQNPSNSTTNSSSSTKRNTQH